MINTCVCERYSSTSENIFKWDRLAVSHCTHDVASPTIALQKAKLLKAKLGTGTPEHKDTAMNIGIAPGHAQDQMEIGAVVSWMK